MPYCIGPVYGSAHRTDMLRLRVPQVREKVCHLSGKHTIAASTLVPENSAAKRAREGRFLVIAAILNVLDSLATQTRVIDKCAFHVIVFSELKNPHHYSA